METFHFSEQPYPDAWDLGLDSLRNTIPNSLCDPQTARQVYRERQDEWLLCDELGINIAFNEHHTSATCLSASPEVTMAIMARITNKRSAFADRLSGCQPAQSGSPGGTDCDGRRHLRRASACRSR